MYRITKEVEMKLGVDIYTIRSQGWNAFQILDYCAGIGLNLVHFSDLNSFANTEDSYLAEVKAHADGLGLSIEVGMMSICPTATIFDASQGTAVEQTTRMLHIASALGSPILRCVLGSNADRYTGQGITGHMQATVETCKAVRSAAMDLGIKLAIENHAGDMQGWELKQLIEQAGPEYVGACIDSGNPVWVGEDPLVTLEHVAPYVATSHVRDSAVYPHPLGAAVQWVAMGDGNVGIETWVERYKALCPEAPLSLEIITGLTPRVLNYLEDSYWETYPNARAGELARFERLVRQGQPYMGTAVTVARGDEVPEEYQAAQVAQQRYDLERSVRYCRETLGIGE
jgi:sugar phosphate isomerase/epimerase